MAELQGSKTEKNLKDAFAGESQANRKYLAFAKKAEQEGHLLVAKLFRAAAEAETVHAHAHLRALGGIGSTADNLKEAIGGETHEFTSMYPEMIKAATNEGFDAALQSFTSPIPSRRSIPDFTSRLWPPSARMPPLTTLSARSAATPSGGPPLVPARSAVPANLLSARSPEQLSRQQAGLCRRLLPPSCVH